MGRLCSVFFFVAVTISALSAQDKQFKDDWTKGTNSPGATLIPKETSRNVSGDARLFRTDYLHQACLKASISPCGGGFWEASPSLLPMHLSILKD